jgi:hypothetical protein
MTDGVVTMNDTSWLANEIERIMSPAEVAAELQRRYRVYLMRGDDPGWVFEFVCQQMEPILAALRAEPDEQEVERAYRAGWKEGYEQCPAIEGLSFGAMYEDECWAEYRAARSRP